MYDPSSHLVDSSVDISEHRTTKNNKCNDAKVHLNLIVTIFHLLKQNTFGTFSFSCNVGILSVASSYAQPLYNIISRTLNEPVVLEPYSMEY